MPKSWRQWCTWKVRCMHVCVGGDLPTATYNFTFSLTFVFKCYQWYVTYLNVMCFKMLQNLIQAPFWWEFLNLHSQFTLKMCFCTLSWMIMLIFSEVNVKVWKASSSHHLFDWIKSRCSKWFSQNFYSS